VEVESEAEEEEEAGQEASMHGEGELGAVKGDSDGS